MIQLDAGQERFQRKPLRAACRDTIRAAFRCPPGEVLNCSNSTIDTIPCDFNEKALRYKRLLNVRETMLHTRPVKLPEEIARGKPILRWFLACFQRNKPLRRTHSTMTPYLKISEAGIHVIRGYTFQSSCPKLLWHTVAHIAG